MKPNSLVRRVTDLIAERGSATVDELMPEFEGFTRSQVLNAMGNARHYGLIHCDQRRPKSGQGRAAGSEPSRHYPGSKGAWMPPPRERQMQVRPPNSAWELAHGSGIAGTWPPKGEGRRYQLMGPWNEDSAP